jgi:hypothetical protein
VLVAAARNARLRRRISGWIVRVPLIRGPRALTTASELGAGVRALGDRRMALEVGAWSLGSWVVLSVSYYAVLRSLGIPSPVRAAVLSLVVTNLVQVIPASAASLGVFEAAGRASIATYGATSAAAVSAAVVLHVINTVPLVIVGVIALARAARLKAGHTEAAERPPALDSSAIGVSVVIPCLDEEATIGKCVRSAWAGIHAAGVDGEVLVVDNGSSDASAERARAAGASCPAFWPPGAARTW